MAFLETEDSIPRAPQISGFGMPAGPSPIGAGLALEAARIRGQFSVPSFPFAEPAANRPEGKL